ncbi:MAG TPA: HPF/RaiA family ribosome-associated protein [Gemmatimonadales bacterium]|jgi:ribosome-associated translation inhibitor RaiA|nr:HPF/RaiA family ribosome-associated protein [Gemmatimonadales bacterium]
MPVTITARHCELPDLLRERANEVAARLEVRVGRPTEIALLFDVDAGVPTAEIRLRAAGEDPVMAAGRGDDHRTALDQAEARVRRQLEKPGTRRLRKRKPTELDNV